MTDRVEFGCPAANCYQSHTAVVDSEGLDKATTSCKGCKNNILVKTRDAQIVTVRVI